MTMGLDALMVVTAARVTLAPPGALAARVTAGLGRPLVMAARVALSAGRLTEVNRTVRADDGGVGWMVGAGHHFSYAGLIEFFKSKTAHGARTSDSNATSSCFVGARKPAIAHLIKCTHVGL